MPNTIGQPQQHHPPDGHTPDATRRPLWPWVVGVGAILVIAIPVLVVIFSGGTPSHPAPSTATASAAAETTYEVTALGGDTATVTYVSGPHARVTQRIEVSLPWAAAVDLGSGTTPGRARVLAQGGESVTSITCRVIRNGVVVARNTSTGKFPAVLCSTS